MVDPTDNTITTTPFAAVEVAVSVSVAGTAPSVKKRSRTNYNNNHRLLQEDEVDDDDILEREKNNPLYMEQYKFLQSLSDIERNYFFCNGTGNIDSQQQQQQYDHSISTTRRSEIWEIQNQIGIQCINQYAWVTPNQQCLHIMAHFIPLIEIGCGTNAYWCQQLISYYCQNTTITSSSSSVMGSNYDPTNVNDIIVGYDISPTNGGKIVNTDDDDENDDDENDTDTPPISKPPNRPSLLDPTTTTTTKKFQVLYGGPNVLAYPENVHRTLFLCYPDENNPNDENDNNNNNKMTAITKTEPRQEPDDEEDDDDGIDVKEDNEDDDNNDEDDDDDGPKEQYSMAYECMKYYTGDIIIHVGELMHVLSPIIGNDTAPYGRTSSIQFQEYFFTHFHCILQYKLPLNWLHTNNDYLTVWKRSTNLTTIVYSSSNNTDEDNVNENDKTETDNPKANNDADDVNDDDDDEEEEVQYRHIPYEERLPIMNVAAPCIQHLWLSKK